MSLGGAFHHRPNKRPTDRPVTTCVCPNAHREGGIHTWERPGPGGWRSAGKAQQSTLNEQRRIVQATNQRFGGDLVAVSAQLNSLVTERTCRATVGSSFPEGTSLPSEKKNSSPGKARFWCSVITSVQNSAELFGAQKNRSRKFLIYGIRS